jgi:hypothetical protein
MIKQPTAQSRVGGPKGSGFTITNVFAPAGGGINPTKFAAFVDGRVFNFANPYGQSQSEQGTIR